jgi:hypothetical protein
MSGAHCIELAGPARVNRLAQHSNVEVIRRRKDRKVVEIQVRDCGNDSRLPAHTSNPLAYVYREEVVNGLAPIFVLKHIPDRARPVFTAVLDSCLAKAA